MLKKVLALTLASAAFVGWFENPAHSDPLEEAALMALATQCDVIIPDAVFMPKVQQVALENGVNIGVAVTLIRAQAELMAHVLIENGVAEEFCQSVQNISFE